MHINIFFIIGGIIISKYTKINTYFVFLLVLIPYFLCVTGVMYNMFDVNRSIILNSEGEQYDQWYMNDKDVVSAYWIGNNYNRTKSIIYTNHFGSLILKGE